MLKLKWVCVFLVHKDVSIDLVAEGICQCLFACLLQQCQHSGDSDICSKIFNDVQHASFILILQAWNLVLKSRQVGLKFPNLVCNSIYEQGPARGKNKSGTTRTFVYVQGPRGFGLNVLVHLFCASASKWQVSTMDHGRPLTLRRRPSGLVLEFGRSAVGLYATTKTASTYTCPHSDIV